MLKKILITLLEIALIALVIYAIITIFSGMRLEAKYETLPWCVTVYQH